MVEVLLDPNTLLWWFTDDGRLSSAVREVIGEESNLVFVSPASAWEIATKQRLGELDDVPQATERFTELVDSDGFTHLPITHPHSLRAGGYRVPHRDPFDRMLPAQAELERLSLVTTDSAFASLTSPHSGSELPHARV